MKRAALIISAVLAAALVPSCGQKQAGNSGPSTEKVKVAFISNNVSDFWKIARAGVEKGEKDFNCQCDFRMPANGTATEQKSILEDLMVKGITGVAISPVNPANQTSDLDRAASQLNLITTDSDAPSSKRLCYIGTNNYDAGKVAGEELKKALPAGGKVMVFVGTLDAENARDRSKGLADAIKGTKIRIIGTMTDNADHAKAKANVEDTLVKHPDIAALVGLWAYNGPAIADAVKAAKKQGKIKVVCFDEDASTLAAIKDGTIEATVVQKPFEFGYQSMKILTALARKEDPGIPPNKIIDTGVLVVNKDNVDSFWKTLKEQTGVK